MLRDIGSVVRKQLQRLSTGISDSPSTELSVSCRLRLRGEYAKPREWRVFLPLLGGCRNKTTAVGTRDTLHTLWFK